MSNENESPGGIVSDKYFFSNATEMELLFAGRFTENLKETEKRLGVTVTARDLCFRISSPQKENVVKTIAFLEELNKLYSATKKRIDQRDFQMTLSAFQESRETELQNFFSQRIKVSPKKQEIVPRTLNQLAYVKAVRMKDVVFGIGPAGTGKTYLAMAMAVTAFRNEEVSRIILTRPAIEAGEKLGFLPGDLQSKVDPYLRPLYDALYQIMGADSFAKNMERGLIEVAPLAYMRGRTLDNAFIILDEAQNTTPAQMKMFLTRIGFGSKVIITGDASQKDLPRDTTSGLDVAMKVLKKIDDIGFCQLTSKDVVRHPLGQQIVQAYDAYEKKQKPERPARRRNGVNER